MFESKKNELSASGVMMNKQVNFRTDLASERRDIYKKANSIENEIQGIESEQEEVNENITVERVKITNESGEKAIGKPQGSYITIDIKKLRIAQEEDIDKSAETLTYICYSR